MAKNNGLWKSIWLGHRHLGLVASLFVFLLAVTGWMLNHAEYLELGKRRVTSPVILSWYGLASDHDLHSFRLGKRWAISLGRGVFLGDRQIAQSDEPLLGAVQIADMLVLATRNELFLVTDTAVPELIDRMGAEALPGKVARIGIGRERELLIETEAGTFRADSDLMKWETLGTAPDAEWSTPRQLPSERRELALARYNGLSLTRFVADLHSGRVLGRFGPLLMDAVALVFVILTMTGFINWLRLRRFRLR